MVFENEFINEMTQNMTAALSFTLDADAEVAIDSVKQVRKVINTYTYSFHGEFAANDKYGEFYGYFSQKDNIKTINEMRLKFGDMDTESKIRCISAKDILDGITNAVNAYNTRKRAQPKIFPQLVNKLDQIDTLAKNTDAYEEIHKVTLEIRDLYGTDLELLMKPAIEPGI